MGGCRVPALWFVEVHYFIEVHYIVEHIGRGLPRHILRAIGSVFNEESKFRIAAMSRTLPKRLIDQTTP